MRTVIFAALGVLATISTTYAQRKSLWVAPQASFGAGKMTNLKVAGNPDPYISLNFNAGADVYYMFTENLGAGTGLALGGYGSEWKGTFNGQNVNYIMGHDNVDIPLFIRYTTGIRHGFFAQAGFISSFLISAVQKIESEDSKETFLSVDGDDAKRDFRSSSIYPFVFFGADIKCGNRVKLSMGPYFQYQLNNDFAKQTPMTGHYLIFGGKLAVGILAVKGD